MNLYIYIYETSFGDEYKPAHIAGGPMDFFLRTTFWDDLGTSDVSSSNFWVKLASPVKRGGNLGTNLFATKRSHNS